MARNNGVKPPTRTTKKNSGKSLKMAVSYTDAEYEEIFSAAIKGPVAQPVEVLEPEAKKSPSQAETSEFGQAIMPSESASVQQHSEDAKKKHKDTASSLSTFNSEDFAKNASSSTQITYRDALNMSRTSLKLSQASVSLAGGGGGGGPLSQAPTHLSHRKRLEWLQARRGIGLWVRCDQEMCQKWRYLDINDPLDVPSKWYCSLNTDPNYNDCEIPEQKQSLFVEEDMIHNAYTAGSIVWAKHPGYPWWPAMVDDCPDTEQYYWINGYSDVPVYYHVVFLDSNKVTRAWIATHRLVAYKKFRDYDTHFRISSWHKTKLIVAKRNADIALELTIKERLARFSFLARWPGEIFTPTPSATDSDDSENTRAIKAAKKKKHQSMKKRRKMAKRRKTVQNTSAKRDLIVSDKENSDEAASISTSQRSVQFNEVTQVHTYPAEDESDAETQKIIHLCERDQKGISRRRNALREVKATRQCAMIKQQQIVHPQHQQIVHPPHQQIVHLQPAATYLNINQNDEDKAKQKRRNAANVNHRPDYKLDSSIVISSDDDSSNSVLFEEDLEPQNAQGIQEIIEDLRSTIETQNRIREMEAPKSRSIPSASFNKLPVILEDDENESDDNIAKTKENSVQKKSFKEPTKKASPQTPTIAIVRKPVKKGFIPPLLKSRNSSPASSTKSSTISPHSFQTAGPSVHGIAVVPNTDDNLLAVLDDLNSGSDPFDLDD